VASSASRWCCTRGRASSSSIRTCTPSSRVAGCRTMRRAGCARARTSFSLYA
jgi:hypothetical protein